ncbi:phosphoribosylformylglycinamidine synthase subunit PurS [Pediococcus acidilactici]|uniref:phosphoribosylformylglycinamidine synthase subunit PurS n=1 Tax=Pediococcus acidilactici TaxID=1254 RepID=UPI00130F772B|nr:phosphoribosylformylglycinamidine synthase subunit PurS [Pediococcus acidilactici]KAF0341334.1 phosphoribosylformylglycinamidine synthase subunit PurS [Pediococcus acidilactici]KAF0352863.1 phosphoribosylformylglycinamidine synthase subunit PurS [Pediococcus acidilactici]KAF0356670.1 phosphoribosylformylglycinamidine synthase subunit PurS [Pediococcus acidilactici]KAF0359228.1 phosphoribosylformylglycinamidine synthase subunit PurS [Pediococcus acidilactici]KAF0375179.1 phosphoribosylformyl
MYKVKVYVTYKESILDPQGAAIKKALHHLNYQEVQKVTVGKYFEIQVADGGQNVNEQIQRMCDELLANVNMETYRFEIQDVQEGEK